MSRDRLSICRFALCLGGVVALIVVAAAGATLFAQGRDRSAELRAKMVEDFIVREGIKNEAVLNSMRTVPRHLFCAPEHRSGAYYDQALPIGHKQTISPPFIVAYMTESIDPQPTDRVLEIGTGSGYQAAVLSGLVKDVYTIEIVEPLGRTAAKVLKDLNYANVHTMIGDGYKGWPEAAPFDKIIVTCSPEDVPKPLIEQLREGGKMIIPLGERYEQVFYLYEKKEGELVRKKLLPALFVPMTGISEDNRKVKPDPAHPVLRNGSFEDDPDGDGRPEGWHYQRQLKLRTTGAKEGQNFVEFENQEPGRAAFALQGFPVDGNAVATLQISLWVKGQNLRNGPSQLERPSLILQFYDADREALPPIVIGPWQQSFDWKRAGKAVHVPPRAREAILRIGLNGGTGVLCVDDVSLKGVAR
jgi:protein-L-isoaspartate(D-aspartate) O-methyltransferase